MFTRSLTALVAILFGLCALISAGCLTGDDETGKGRTGINSDDSCPDPDDPQVYYMDDTMCDDLPEFPCGDEQTPFNDECGCGCIDLGMPLECPDSDDPLVYYMDDAMCDDLPEFPCGDEQTPFNNECGCGCIDLGVPVVSEGLLPGFEAGLTEVGGCSDMYVYAHTLDDDIALFFHVGDLVAGAYEAGGEQTTELSLADSDLSLEIHVGERLSRRACNDAISPDDEPLIESTYTAVNGTVTITVTTEGDPEPWGAINARATLTFTDIVFESDADTDAVALDHLELTNVAVGWMPG